MVVPHPRGMMSWVLVKGRLTYQGSCDLNVRGHVTQVKGYMTQAMRGHYLNYGMSCDLSS